MNRDEVDRAAAAITSGDLESLKQAIASGVQPHDFCGDVTYENNLVHLAAAVGQLELLQYLVAQGADLTRTNKHGWVVR